MAIGAVLAGGQALMGLASGISKGREARRSAIAQHGNRVFNNQFQNLMIDRQNELTRQRFGKQIELAQTQFNFNREAAQRAQSQEQYRMMEYNQGRAFDQLNDRASLLQAMGANAERGGSGNRSFQLAALKGTQGRAGVQRAVDAESSRSAFRSSRMRMEQISRDRLSADNRAFSNVAISPQLRTRNAALAAPTLPRMNMGLMIGQAAMQFGMGAMANTANDGQFLGLKGDFFKKG